MAYVKTSDPDIDHLVPRGGVQFYGQTRARTRVDAIIAASGFRPGLDSLVGHLGVLDARGEPRVRNGNEAMPGLRFIGFEPVPALLLDVTRKARRIARSIANERQRRVSPEWRIV